uniref:Uncharacterized protein n=1 Tax=Seriola dumerili TaxID=41447 RepID=A0A3B4UTF4_SERDU
MSSFSIIASLAEDHFQCSICLNVFSDPVTTPCGHNFCKTCLSEHWDNSELCQCPTCNKRFYMRPEISTNTVIEEISVQIKRRKSVTFDQATAGCGLRVTQFGNLRCYKPASPSSSDDILDERFDFPMILGKKGFTSGRHYWEVQVGLRSNWDVGVAKETVNRTGRVSLKKENGFFAIGKRGFDYQAHCTPFTALHLCPRPKYVGVYLDYEEGLVSFYNLTAQSHIYSFTECPFRDELFPYFSPHVKQDDKNGDPLIISAVKQCEQVKAGPSAAIFPHPSTGKADSRTVEILT